MKLKDKIALVTGSSTGIGQGIATRFAKEGADVVINYNRTPAGAEETLREVEAAGRKGLIVQANLANVSEIRALFDKAIDQFGRVDIALVNNAGIEINAPFWEVTEGDYATRWSISI
ncbi:MAG: SDR family NAD(P)-dependent oxidoreductase [Terriglobia bacterium]